MFERITKSCLEINCVSLSIFLSVEAHFYLIQVNIAQRRKELWFSPHLLRTLKKTAFRRVSELAYARIISCIPMSSTFYCYVNAIKLLNKMTLNLNCRERIRQSIRKIKYRASQCLTLFSCKSEDHIANYCNYKLSTDILVLKYIQRSWSSNICWP